MIRKHLDKGLFKLFSEFTGLCYHVAWAPAPDAVWDIRMTPAACFACRRRAGRQTQPREVCRTCGPANFATALKSHQGHRFLCKLGILNYWLPIRVRDETPGIACLQALDKSASRSPAGKPTELAARALRRRGAVKVQSRWEFARASRLLRFIIRSVQTASVSDLREADLTRAGLTAIALRGEQRRLSLALKGDLPPPPGIPRRADVGSHPHLIVRQLLEWMERDYGKPITLKTGAAKLRMNAAYLSALFSRVAGTPFKSYLTRLRLEKAAELLGDPAQTASAVASAVGYASEDRFRAAFKKATGLPPKLWRETIPTQSPSSFA